MGKILHRHWLLILAAVSAAMLAAAHGFEHFGELPPCLLCLKQREVYWVLLTTSLSGWAVGHRFAVAHLLALGLAVAILGAGIALAGYHAGAEWQLWPGPAACAAGGAVDVMALNLGAALAGPVEHPSCDQVLWSWLGISMAGWNGLISLALWIITILKVQHDTP
jgi:disulfide bond formation protein DsbB